LCLLGHIWPSHFDKKSDETSEHAISNVQSSFKKSKASVVGFFLKESGRKFGEEGESQQTACSFGWWLMTDVVLREKYCWLVADGWFVLREKNYWPRWLGLPRSPTVGKH
jgi:hypothetical protein